MRGIAGAVFSVAALLAMLHSFGASRADPAGRAAKGSPTLGASSAPALDGARAAGPGGERAAPAREDPHAARVRDLHARVTSALEERLRADPRNGEYEACLQRGTRCSALLSAMVYQALYEGLLDALDTDAFGIRALLEGDGEPATYAQLAQLASQAQRPVERIAALVVLDRADGFVPRALPPHAYRDLEQRSVVEAQLILARHRFVPLPDAVAAQAVLQLGLAADGDRRLVAAAVDALGHAGTAGELAQLVRDGELDAWSREQLSHVLGHCGMACAAAVDALVARGEEADLDAAHRALEWSEGSQRDALAQRVYPTPAEVVR